MDTQKILELREELKQTILDSFLEEFPQYEAMTEDFDDIRFEEEEIESWKEGFSEELETIDTINDLEEEVNNYGGDDFEDTHFIEESEFTEYCKELLRDCGDLPSNLPFYIEDNINWDGVADDLRVDYAEVEYDGKTYLFR